MLQRILCILTLALILLLVLTGCGGEVTPSVTPSETPTATPTPSPTPSPSPSASNGLKTINGYLVDQKCGLAGKDTNGNDMTAHPEKHTVKCLKTKSHADSGYGMEIRQSDGSFKFYKFDKASSNMLKRQIVDKTEKTDDILIAVRGTMNDDDTITAKVVLNYGLK